MDNKVALVTGGAGGIGRATSKLFAEKGAQVVVADVNVEAGKETVEIIKDAGGEATFKKCDVTEQTSVDELVEFAVETYGSLDFAVNNAGIEGERAKTADCEKENWDSVIDINLTGVWQCMKSEIPKMLETGGGAIVNTSSVAGLVGFDHLPAYVASKHGVAGLTKSAALEYSSEGIRINAISPGVIETDMVARAFKDAPEVKEALLETKPIGRLGQPEEMAEVIVWLCSDSASFVTGHILAADGGYVAR